MHPVQASALAPCAAQSKLDVCRAGGTLLQNAVGFPSGVLDGGKGEGGSALGSGCCREHPLVDVGHRDFFYLLAFTC